MTISNQDGRSGPFNGTSSDGGSTGTFTFAYDFKVLDQSHLVVTVTTTSTGAAVTKTITTDYTVTGVGTDSGGNVTFVAGKAPLSTETVTITRAVPLTQLTDLQNRGGVQPSVLEESFDKLTQITQDTKEVQARTLRFPVASTLSGIEMPLTATNDAVLAWSSDGTKLVNGPTSGQISSAESSATAAAASAVTAANEASATAPKYTFSTTTSVADPGTGTVRLNHATASSASIIVLDDQTADTGNPNVEDWLKTFDDSTSTIKGWIRLVEAGTPANYAIYNVTGITDSSGFIQVAVSHVDSNFASGTTFGNSAGLRLFFSRTGDKGDTGSQGIQGIQGDEAGVLPYVFATSTSDADPGAGKLRFNNGTLSSVSQIFIDDQSNSSGNPDVSALLLTWDDSTNVSDKGTIVVSKKSALQNYFIGRLTSLVDASGYVKLVVTHVTSNGSFSADDDLLVEFQRTGNAGSLDDPMTTRGDIIVRNSSNTTARLAVGSANTVLKSDGTDISWGYTVGTSANNLVQLNGSAALPAVSGANLTNLPASGGTVDLTASGAVTAGKTLILNSDGTVSQVANNAITEVIGSAYTPSGETASDRGVMDYNTTADKFMLVGQAIISSTTATFASVLALDSSMAITETVAPTQVSGVGPAYSGTYSATHDRLLVHYQQTSPYYVGINTISYSSSNGLDIDGISSVNSTNYPYGSSIFMHTNDATVATHFPHTTSTPSYVRFSALTTGSDATGDSFSFSGGNVDVGISGAGQYGNYYTSPIYFPTEDKMMFLHVAYHTSGVTYRPRLNYGSVSGTGASATFSEDGEDNWSDSERFSDSGQVRYESGINRAVFWDGKFMRTLGMEGGYAKSALQTIQSSYPSTHNKDVRGIPGTDKIVLFGSDDANSERLSYWVVTVTTGTTAASDSFSVDGPHEISTDTTNVGLSAAYSPDVDGFLVRTNLNSDVSKTYGVRVGRSSTNVTSSNFIGFASNSASDGQTVTVQLPSAVATPTQGSLTTGTTYYVKNDGTIGTSNQGYGLAGRAVSSTKLVVEERA